MMNGESDATCLSDCDWMTMYLGNGGGVVAWCLSEIERLLLFSEPILKRGTFRHARSPPTTEPYKGTL